MWMIPVRWIAAGVGGWVVGNTVVDTVQGPKQSPVTIVQGGNGSGSGSSGASGSGTEIITSGVSPFLIISVAILLIAIGYAVKAVLTAYFQSQQQQQIVVKERSWRDDHL